MVYIIQPQILKINETGIMKEEAVSFKFKIFIFILDQQFIIFLADKSDKRNRRNEPYRKYDRSSHRDHRSSRTPSIRRRDEPLTPNVRVRDSPSRSV